MIEYRLESELKWRNCARCPLCAERHKTVLGFGNPSSRLMVIGEAPGEQEDTEGVPFVGAAGQMLDLYFKFVGLSRPDDMVLDNIVACRPPGNRKPTEEEIAACFPRLRDAIYEVDPYLILAMGGTAFQSLTNDKTMITKARGELFPMRLPGWYVKDLEYPVMALFHPSFILRNRTNKRPGSPFNVTGDDFVLAMELYDRLRNVYDGIPIPER